MLLYRRVPSWVDFKLLFNDYPVSDESNCGPMFLQVHSFATISKVSLTWVIHFKKKMIEECSTMTWRCSFWAWKIAHIYDNIIWFMVIITKYLDHDANRETKRTLVVTTLNITTYADSNTLLVNKTKSMLLSGWYSIYCSVLFF